MRTNNVRYPDDKTTIFAEIIAWERGLFTQKTDELVAEEPLEIILRYWKNGRQVQKNIAITMRTPGEDAALATGFLFSEGIIGRKADLETWEQLGPNRIMITLKQTVAIELSQLERHFYTTSSCGVCGKTAIELLEKITCYFPVPAAPVVEASRIANLPKRMAKKQALFAKTGGIHAAALLDLENDDLLFAEDVGRHNAVDKLIGKGLLENCLPFRNHILLLSGRAGFELVQKAMMAGIPIVAAVGAPSSLAVELAKNAGLTLIGFLKKHRFNVYCGTERLKT